MRAEKKTINWKDDGHFSLARKFFPPLLSVMASKIQQSILDSFDRDLQSRFSDSSLCSLLPSIYVSDGWKWNEHTPRNTVKAINIGCLPSRYWVAAVTLMRVATVILLSGGCSWNLEGGYWLQSRGTGWLESRVATFINYHDSVSFKLTKADRRDCKSIYSIRWVQKLFAVKSRGLFSLWIYWTRTQFLPIWGCFLCGLTSIPDTSWRKTLWVVYTI